MAQLNSPDRRPGGIVGHLDWARRLFEEVVEDVKEVFRRVRGPAAMDLVGAGHVSTIRDQGAAFRRALTLVNLLPSGEM